MSELAEATALWEAKYNADQLKAMLAKGHAIANEDGAPSYPIEDEEDLKRAIKAVGRGGGSHNKIRAYIIKRAKALGKSDLIPDDWSTSGASATATKESAAPEGAAPESVSLVETTSLSEATGGAADGSGRRRRIQLIDAGWSKNGRYYPASTLSEAARGRVYPAGTPMFVDHPTVSEQSERPERSVRDLAARLVTDARFEDGALVAEAELFGAWRPVINDIADHIGVSIRAAGTMQYGEAEGREGPIVTALTEGISVDFVTSPARGGKILELIESARPGAGAGEMKAMLLAEARNVGAWLESRLHCTFTEITDGMYGEGRLTRDERIALSSAIGDALDAFVKRVEADQPQLYQRDLWQTPEQGDDAAVTEADNEATPTAPAAQGQDNPGAQGQGREDTATEADKNAPGSPPADTTPIKEEGSMPELTEAEARQLQESRDAALAEAEKARNEAAAANAARAESDLRLARFDATESARPIAAKMLTESDLPAAAQGRLIGALVTSATVPLNGDNKLDETAFRASVEEAITSEQAYLASLQEQAGIGTPRGLGNANRATDEPDEAAVAKTTEGLIESYRANGLSEAAARLAATGRPF